MIGRHWHVMAGTVGCLPEGNAVFTSRREAERYAVEEARTYREAGYLVQGSARTFYTIEPINYLMVEPCYEADCLTDEL